MRIHFVCPHCKVARTWASSRVLAGHYLVTTIKAYENALKRTLIYRFAGSFCRVCSFMQVLLVISLLGPNSRVETPSGWSYQLLTYLPKRIHFHTNNFKMRINLA